ncbi:MAG: DUF4340 domain-containing protein [Ruminiclostridium sp.]|nr:DUF4340 domain-containing protein [Ruminiclostridium sp.]
MSKNKQILIWSLVGVAVLGAVTAVLLLTAPPKDTGTGTGTDTAVTGASPEDSKLILSDRLKNDITRVSVTNGEDSYTLTPTADKDDKGDFVWTIANIASAPLDTAALGNAAEAAGSFEAKEFVEETTDASMLAKYGLAEPRAKVTAAFGDGTEFSFSLGDDVPSSSTSVYMTADGKSVYTCSKSYYSAFFGNRYSFVQLTAVPDYQQSTEQILNMTIERTDFEKPLCIEVIEPGDDDAVQVYTYRLTSPYYAYMDLTNAPTFLYSLFGLKAASCEIVGITDEIREAAGLNKPVCTVAIKTDLRDYSLTIGAPIYTKQTAEDGTETSKITGFYGVSGDYPDILYSFTASDLEVLTIKPETLISRLFLMPYIYSLSSVRYTEPSGRDITLGIETIKAAEEGAEDEHKYTLNGEPTAEEPLKNLYQFMISAAGEELYFDEDRGELLAEITYTYNDPTAGMDGKDIVTFYASNTDRKVIIALNGSNLFKTRQMYATQLIANVDNYLNGREIVETY